MIESVSRPARDEGAGDRLRAALQALKPVETPHRSAAPVSSVFGRAAAAVPADVHPPAGREVVVGRMTGVATSAQLPGTALALVVVPSSGAALELMPHCFRLVASGAVVVVLGPDLPRAVADRTRPLSVPLREDDSLSQEWGLVVCGPARRTALLARQDGSDRQAWRWLSTRDSIAVHRAGTAILERVPFLNLFVPALAPAVS